jgi:signal transduction histidine kinase
VRMNWLPDSMFGRLFAAVCVPIVIMLGISYALVAADRRQLVEELGGSNQTVLRVEALTRELLPLTAADRAAAIAKLKVESLQPDRFREVPPAGDRGRAAFAPGPRATLQMASIQELYLQPLQQNLGANCKLAAESADRGREWVVDLARPPLMGGRSLVGNAPVPFGGDMGPPPPGDRGRGPGPGPGAPGPNAEGLLDLIVACGNSPALYFRVTAPPSLPTLSATLAWQLLALTLMLGVALYVATRRLTTPLTELQRAANAMGRAMPPPRIEARGAREIRESLQAFNTMQDRLRRYLDSRTRVLAAMSHDLRTPLTRLRLRAETVDQPAIRNRLVADIEEMDSLVNRSLSLFRGLNDEEASVDVNIDELLAGLSAEFRELGQTVPVQGRSNASIKARPLALKRALRNLIENAIKYGQAARMEVSDGDALAITISDSGPGIPAAQLESVFEPFFRLESSRGRDTGGVGLGLSIARDVAEMHGGNVRLRNIDGGGLAATLTLPHRLE